MSLPNQVSNAQDQMNQLNEAIVTSLQGLQKRMIFSREMRNRPMASSHFSDTNLNAFAQELDTAESDIRGPLNELRNTLAMMENTSIEFQNSTMEAQKRVANLSAEVQRQLIENDRLAESLEMMKLERDKLTLELNGPIAKSEQPRMDINIDKLYDVYSLALKHFQGLSEEYQHIRASAEKQSQENEKLRAKLKEFETDHKSVKTGPHNLHKMLGQFQPTVSDTTEAGPGKALVSDTSQEPTLLSPSASAPSSPSSMETEFDNFQDCEETKDTENDRAEYNIPRKDTLSLLAGLF